MVFRAAVIGCGKIGSEFSDDPRIKGIFTHAAAYTACPSTKLVAVCDPDIGKLKKCQRRWQVPKAYTDYQEMLDEVHPDLVSICTPDNTHAEIIDSCIQSPELKGILAEKPLATNIRKAEAIVQKAEDKNIVLAVNYTRRFDPVHREIRNLLKNGLIGDIQTVNGYYSKGTLHNGTHLFDLARFLVGDIIQVRGFQHLHDSDTDPTLDGYLVFSTGATGFFHACDESAFTLFEMDIVGTHGRIQFLESGHIVNHYTVAEDAFYSGYQGLSLHSSRKDGLHNVLLHAVDDLARCIKKGETPLCSGRDALDALSVASALQNSARNSSRLQTVNRRSNP